MRVSRTCAEIKFNCQKGFQSSSGRGGKLPLQLVSGRASAACALSSLDVQFDKLLPGERKRLVAVGSQLAVAAVACQETPKAVSASCLHAD